MVRRGELTDEAWGRIAPLMPENGRRGKQWRNHRTVVNGIVWKLRTGAPWRDLPEHYGPWQTCYDRFVRWRRDGTWERLLAHAQTRSDAVGEVEWEVSVDSTVVRAGRFLHQAAPLLRRQGPPALRPGDGGPAQRGARAGGPARRDTGGAARRDARSSPQEARAALGRPRLRPRLVPGAAEETWHPAHDPRAQGPEGAPPEAWRQASVLRRRCLPETQRGGEVREPAQAVARGGDEVREAGGQLPGDGPHRLADDLAVLVSHQTRPSPRAFSSWA